MCLRVLLSVRRICSYLRKILDKKKIHECHNLRKIFVNYSANRKKADARKTGGGPAPPPLTEAEELALSHNIGRPVAEGIPGGSSSSESTPQDLLDGSDRFISRENDKHG
ncbi:hypothetical protein N1851_003428 [Merluccius polli]|uniref:Uncharacterized protein n=1 Tax=Merluccius polli TaxID=89951 RepID=A0AA47NAF4_MERPO|nr:hypothetical protein N1851_003428 [Merluccius polli]